MKEGFAGQILFVGCIKLVASSRKLWYEFNAREKCAFRFENKIEQMDVVFIADVCYVRVPFQAFSNLQTL